MADFIQNIKVTADTKQAERQLDKLTGQLEQLQRAGGLKFELFGSGAGLKNAISGNLPAALKRTGEAFGVGAAQVNKFAMAARNLDSQIKSGAIRGGVGALGLALAKMAPATAPAVKGVGALTTALTGLVAKTTALAGGLGGAGAAIAGVGAGIDTAAKAAVGGSNAIQELLLYLKDLPNSWGLAAVAAMAFAPAAITAGKAINTAVGTQATQKIAELTAGIRNAASAAEKLEGSVISAGNAFEALLQGSSLNQLNAQLRDAVRQSGEFESSTVQAWEAAQQLASAMKLQTVEQKKINDLVRQAKGLQTQDVRDTEVSRRMALLTSGRNAQKQMAAEQSRLNTELEDYARLAAEVAAQTKAWADNLTRVERSSKAGVLGNKSQIQARLEEMRANNRSAQIARERSAALQGKAYGLNQVPAGGQLFPGGNTMTAQPGYRAAQNAAATYKQAAEAAKPLLQQAQQRTILEGKSLQVVRNRTSALREQAAVDKNSIAILRQQNAERIKAAQLDERALTVARRQTQLADLRNKKKKGEELQGRIENTLVSGAFPLLFGAGPLATLGGFAGGALGSANPMIGVFTSALGQMVDQFGAAAIDMGKSLRDPITNFQKLADAGLLASKSQEYYIQRLIEVGRITEATAVIQGEMVKKIGVDGVNDLQQVSVEADNLSKAWAELSLSMQGVIAGPLGEMLRLFAGPVKTMNGVNQMAALEKDLKAAGLGGKFDEFRKRDQAFRSLGPEEGTKARLKLIEEYRKLLPPPALNNTKTDPEAQQKAAEARLATAERAEALRRQNIQLELAAVDQRRNIEDQVFSFRRRAADFERANLDLKRSIEDRIFDQRQSIARQESDNLRQRDQLTIDQRDRALNGLRLTGNQPGTELANQWLDATRTYIKARSEGEANLREKERTFRIDMADFEREAYKFRLQVELTVGDLKRQAVDYERDVQKTILQNERWLLDRRIAVADYELAERKQGIAEELDAAKRLQMTNATTTSVSGGGNLGSGAYPLTSERGPRWGRPHHGRDYATPIGTPISTTLAGKVNSSGYEGGYGNWVEVQLENGVKAFWAHLSEVVLKQGQTFKAGQVIARTGNTGRGTGPHLHSGDNSIGNAGDAYTRLGGRAFASATTQVSPIFQRPGAAANNVVPTGGLARPDLSMPSFSAPGVKPIDVSGLLAQSDALKTQGARLKLEAHEIGKQTAKALIDGAKQDLDQQLKTLQAQLTKPFDEMLFDQQQQANYQKQYSELLSKGILPDLAEQLVNIRQQVELKVQELNLAIAVQQAVVDALKTEYDKTKDLEQKSEIMEKLIEQQEYLNKLKGIEPSIREGGKKAEEGAKQAQSPGDRLQGAYDKAQGELNKLLDPVNQVIAGANAIGSAFGTAFKDVASGAKSAQQALADAFQSIAGHFLDMAAQMIAKYIEMQVIGLAMNFLGSAAGGFGGFSGAGPVAMPGAGVGGGSSMFMPGAPSFMATGGFVTGPTKAMIGEGGESEYVIPSSKMGSAMARWNAGSRGSSVIDGADPTGGPSSTGGSGAMTISVTTGPVLQFEGRNYVTQDQFTSGMRSTAKQAEQQTLRRMQHSPSTRRKIGV